MASFAPILLSDVRLADPFAAVSGSAIDLLVILQEILDRALFLCKFIREIQSSGVRGSITIMHIRKSFKLHYNIVRYRFFPRIAKRFILAMLDS